MIRPKCQRCGNTSEQAVAPVGTGPTEFYCKPCVGIVFAANLTPVAPPMREVSSNLAKRHVTGTN